MSTGNNPAEVFIFYQVFLLTLYGECSIIHDMKEKKENKCDPNYVRSVVVEVFTYMDLDTYPRIEHQVVTSRDDEVPNHIRYHYLFASEQPTIEFGDHLLCDPQNAWYICRGPLLKYHIKVDAFPSSLIRKLIMEREKEFPPFQPRFGGR